MRTSYHVHTSASDGGCTISDHVRAALSAGLDELGISDHLTIRQGQDTDWSMPAEQLDFYFASLETARKDVGNRLVIRSGIEVDYIPESLPQIRQILANYPFDYVIGSVHFVGNFPVDRVPEDWDAMSQEERNEKVVGYWNLVKKMAETRLFDIAGHLDLHKKFGHRPTIDISRLITAALDAISAADMAVELNASGLYKPVHEIYPAPSILQECHRRGIPSLVTTDAHAPEDLVRGIDEGIEELRKAGYTKQAIFADRRRTLVDL